jgi:hypothetical protein
MVDTPSPDHHSPATSPEKTPPASNLQALLDSVPSSSKASKHAPKTLGQRKSKTKSTPASNGQIASSNITIEFKEQHPETPRVKKKPGRPPGSRNKPTDLQPPKMATQTPLKAGAKPPTKANSKTAAKPSAQTPANITKITKTTKTPAKKTKKKAPEKPKEFDNEPPLETGEQYKLKVQLAKLARFDWLIRNIEDAAACLEDEFGGIPDEIDFQINRVNKMRGKLKHSLPS